MLVKKLLLFGIILFAAEQLFFHAILKDKMPLFWGNEELNTKFNYLSKHPEINTVFVGSSKVRSQILPAVFDSVTQGKTNSFNLGCNGLFIPESYNLLDELINRSKVKTIVFELRPVYHIYKQNLHISRNIYYHTAASYAAVINNTWHSSLPVDRKLSAYSSFTISLIENLLNFNFTDGYINYKNFKVSELETQYAITKGCEPRGRGKSEHLKRDSSGLPVFAAVSIDNMKRFKEDEQAFANYNAAYLEEMNELVKRASDKKINIVLVFPPAVRDFEYREVLPLLKQMKDIPSFILADASEYPELYKVENNYEADHLNLQGSWLYSTYLGRQYNQAFK